MVLGGTASGVSTDPVLNLATRLAERRASEGRARTRSHLNKVMAREGEKFPVARNSNEGNRRRLGADRGPQGVGDRLRESLHVGLVFGLDHDAGQRLRARVAQHDATVVAQRRLRFRERAGNFGQ